MGSLPPAEAIPLLPARTATATTATVQNEGWRYVDEARSHEIVVTVRGGASPAFVVHERAPGANDPRDAYERVVPMEGVWEARLHHFALEQRLTLLGNYHRQGGAGAQGAGWTPVRRNTTGRRVNLDPMLMPEDRGAEFHYYGSRHHDVTALLVATRVRTAQGMRYHLARLLFRFPDAANGEVVVIHPRLPPALLRSALAQHDLEYQELRMEKLVFVDRSARGNAEWCARLDACLAQAQERIARGQFGGNAPRIPTVEPTDLAKDPKRAYDTRNYEVDDADPTAEERARPEARKIEDVAINWSDALRHPRILALHRRYLTPEEEAAALAEGEMAIRRLILAKRAIAPAAAQHFLSILEASLLVRHELGPGGKRRLDPAHADLLRRTLAYL